MGHTMTLKSAISLIILLSGPFQLTLVSTTCISDDGPSPYEYGIDQQMEQRAEPSNLVAGWRQYGDRLLFQTEVTVEREVGHLVTTTLQYPANGSVGSNVITHVLSLNQPNFYYASVAYIMEGGVGFNYVKIGFQSQKDKGIYHLVSVYGKETKPTARLVH